jgi:hypothetical protein
MNSTAPQIGFDRFIQLDLAAAALKVRAGTASLDELNEMVKATGLGIEAKQKTRTKLNALWLEPRVDLVGFSNRGVEIFKLIGSASVPALNWGMAIASYSFFGKVAELIGRLSALHGDCTSLEIHRRISEAYGEREVTKRATQAVIQTQANWGAVERVEQGKRLVRRPSMTITNDELIAWLIEAALWYVGRTIPVSTLQSLAVLYPFVLDRPLTFVVSRSANVEVQSEGSSNQFVALRPSL